MTMKNKKNRDGGIQDVEVRKEGPEVFANLTRDAGFKIVLGTEGQSEELLKKLLNRLLPEAGIVELQYLPTEHFGTTEDDGKSVFDVYCKDRGGSRFLVEMQMWSQHYFHKRAVYYASRSVMDQAKVERKYQKEVLHKDWDYNFAPVFVFCFLNFPSEIVGRSGLDAEKHIAHYVFRSMDSGRLLGDNVNLIFVDLYRFRKEYDECESMVEKWLYSLKNMYLLEKQPGGVEGTELEELYKEAYMAKWSPEKKDIYKVLMTKEEEMRNIMREHEEDAYNDGLAIGREEGREEGREKGREEGRIGTIRQLLESGMSVDLIAQALNLTEEEKQKLQ